MLKKTFALTIALAGGLTPFAQAQSLSEAEAEIASKLEASLAELSSVRSSIRDEKIPLSKELNSLQAELKTLQKEAARIERLRENRNYDLEKIEESVSLRREELDFVSNLLLEYARGMESRAALAELASLTPSIDAALEAADAEDPSGITEQAKIMLLGLDRASDLVGGATIEGQAILPDGSYEPGKFLLFGPVTYFSSSKSGMGGIAQRGASSEPNVVSVDLPDAAESIASVATSGSGSLPIDATLGNAIALASTKETITEHIAKGGIWVYPILGFAFVSLAVALFKALEIYSIKTPSSASVGELFSAITSGDQGKAIHIANEMPGPTGKMFLNGAKNMLEDKETVEEVLYEEMLETKPKVNRFLPFIAVTAATAPLMGLLGTVTGMINTFKLITIFGTGDARSLSSGISEALITTEFGLIVAIPSLILHAMLSRRAGSILGRMEKSAVAFVNSLPKSKSEAA